MLAAEKRQETHFLSNEETDNWIKDFVERESAVARKRVQDIETAMMQELKNLTSATGKHKRTYGEKLNAIGDSLSDNASSDDKQDREDEEDDEDDTGLGMLSDDNVPGWVMSTISKMVQHRMESGWEKQMRLDQLTQPGWGDADNDFCERDMKHGTAELKVPEVVMPQTVTTAASASPTTAGENMQILAIVREQLEMQAVTSRPGSIQMRLGSEKPQSNKFIPVL
jgi:hypothetical protein